MTSYSRQQFLEEYKLDLEKEFEYHGRISQWTAQDNGPRLWGGEDESIKLKKTDPVKDIPSSTAAAVTLDSHLLAVSANTVIQVYDIDSRVNISELVGHERSIQKLFFVDCHPNLHRDRAAKYILVSQSASAGSFGGQIYAWHIDSDGNLLREFSRMPFAVQSFADRSIDAITDDLVAHHDLSTNATDAIREGYVGILKVADAKNRSEPIPHVDGAFPGFGTKPISYDRTKLLHTVHGNTTQSGMRPPDQLPQIVVRDVRTLEERCRLRGHKDAIMWAGWSLDDKVIATASWDKTFKIWDAETGACKHTIGETGGQNWAGSFLPDGKHILLSGGQPVKFGIYSLETGHEVGHLLLDGSIKLDGWLRYFAVNFANDLLVLQNNITLLLWKPLQDLISSSSSTSSEVHKVFAFKHLDQRLHETFLMIDQLKWVDGGTKLLAQSSENTTFVWDMEKNLKWRFQRPQGLVVDFSKDCFFVKRKGAEWVITLDADHVIRFWKL